MASTTKTTNLELSQFVGTDKPAWLTDYNGDMQKIDNGYKKLEDANTATQADLDATKQDLSGSQTDIADVKADVQALEAQDIAIGNRLTVVEGNYDTMHHEVAINQQSIDDIETDLGMDTPLTTTATTVHGAINEHQTKMAKLTRSIDYGLYLDPVNGNDDNDGHYSTTPVKTIEKIIELSVEYKTLWVLYIKSGTTITLPSGRLILSNLMSIVKYDTGDNPKVQFNTTVSAYFNTRLNIENITFEHTGDSTERYLTFYGPALRFNNCSFTGSNFRLAVGCPTAFNRATFNNLVMLNTLGGLVTFPGSTGSIAEINGWGSLILINETALTVTKYTSPYVKNILQ